MHHPDLPRRRQFLLCLQAAALGGISTLIAWVLLWSINLFTNLFYYQKFSTAAVAPSVEHLGWFSILIPALGGLIVGVMAKLGSKAIRGHGIPEAMEKVLFGDSKIAKRVVILKPLSSAIAIGSGGPFGAEGPIIATGGALGSLWGQVVPTGPFERKVLLSAGAAGGMTAIFGTPLAALLLAIELLLFEYRAQSFIPVALSAVVAATFRTIFWTDAAFFEIPQLHPATLVNFPAYLLSGALFGVLSILVTRSVYAIEDSFEKLPVHWMWWPALGGLFVGAVGYIEPASLGVGYGNIEAALNGSVTWNAALWLCLWKFLSWSVALGSGTSGGTLAPLLTIGSLLGLALGHLLVTLFPSWGVDPNVLALIGMAALFTGCSRALLATVIFSLEATKQPVGLVPMLGACAISYLISHWWMKQTIMTEKIARRGLNVPSGYVPHEPLQPGQPSPVHSQ